MRFATRSRALELEGYDVELAVDGADALHRLEANGQPDAVILDVLMPGVDGLEVCRRIRGKGNGVPVLMLTARTEVESRVAGLDAGADDYLPKPFALEELLARLSAPAEGLAGRREILRFDDLELNPNTREVGRAGGGSSSRARSSTCSSSSCGIPVRCSRAR